MNDQTKRRWLFLGAGGVIGLMGLWFAIRLLNPLAGVWENDYTVCTMGLFGGGECADKDLGRPYEFSIHLGSNEMTIGSSSGTFEMLPGNGDFVWTPSGQGFGDIPRRFKRR